MASALWVVLCGALLYVTQGLIAAARQMSAQQKAYMQLAHLIETWDAESSSALAIFVPPQDVHGSDNSDGHEVDFYSRDASGNGRFWAYGWQHAGATLQRYTYTVPGGSVSGSDPPITGITTFTATRRSASAIGAPFLGGYVPRDVAVNFGYPGVDGGNAVTTLTVGNSRSTFTIELLPGAMVSGFQIVVSTFTPTSTPAPTAAATPAPPAALYRIVPYTSATYYPCYHGGPTSNCTPYTINGQQCDVSNDGGLTWKMLFWEVPAVTSCP